MKIVKEAKVFRALCQWYHAPRYRYEDYPHNMQNYCNTEFKGKTAEDVAHMLLEHIREQHVVVRERVEDC
jgi:hypothetical protein